MGSWFSSLFTGSNPVLNTDINQAGASSNFATGVGESDVTAASKFDQSLLSGDPTQVAETLAPEIVATQKRAQEQKLQDANFGTRSGGTAAASAAADAGVNADILTLEGGLKQGAASSLAGIGTSEQGIGLSANQQQAQEAEARQQAEKNSILGQAITGGIDYAESFLPVAHGGSGGGGTPGDEFTPATPEDAGLTGTFANWV